MGWDLTPGGHKVCIPPPGSSDVGVSRPDAVPALARIPSGIWTSLGCSAGPLLLLRVPGRDSLVMLEVFITERSIPISQLKKKRSQLFSDIFLPCDFTQHFASLSKENGQDCFSILTQVALHLPTRVEDFLTRQIHLRLQALPSTGRTACPRPHQRCWELCWLRTPSRPLERDIGSPWPFPLGVQSPTGPVMAPS